MIAKRAVVLAVSSLAASSLALAEPPLPHKTARPASAPLLPPTPDAKLTWLKGRVDTYTPAPTEGKVDAPLRRNDRVATVEQSAAEITFLDGTSVELERDSLFVVLGDGNAVKGKPRPVKKSKVPVLAESTLMNGAAHLTVAPGKQLGLVAVQTHAAFAAGEYVVSIDDKHAVRVSALRGKATLTVGKQKLELSEGFGCKIDDSKAPPTTTPLALRPAWTDPTPVTLVAATESDLDVGYAAAPPGGAPTPAVDNWRVQLGHAGSPRDTLVDTRVPAATTRLAFPKLAVGGYVATVQPIDGAGFVGPPSPPLEVFVVPVEVTPSPRTGEQALALPDGFDCTVDEVAQKGKVSVAGYVSHSVRCKKGEGRTGRFVVGPMAPGALSIAVTLSEANADKRTGRLSLVVRSPNDEPLAGLPLNIAFEAGTTAQSGDARVSTITDEHGEATQPIAWDTGRLSLAMTVLVDVAKTEQQVSVAVPSAPPAPPPPSRGMLIGARVSALSDARGQGSGAIGMEVGYWQMLGGKASGTRLSASLLATYTGYRPSAGQATTCDTAEGLYCFADPRGRSSAILKDEHTLTLAVPVALTFPGKPGSRWSAYGGVFPELVFDRRTVEAFGRADLDAVHFGFGVFAGLEVACEPARFFFEVGYQMIAREREPNDHTLSSVLFTLGTRYHMAMRPTPRH